MTEQQATNVRQRSGVAVLDLSGEVDGSTRNALDAAFFEAMRAESESILLNFTNVEYINSTGIAILIELVARAREARRRMLACGLSDHYTRIFDITRLSDFIAVYPDEERAIAAAATGRRA